MKLLIIFIYLIATNFSYALEKLDLKNLVLMKNPKIYEGVTFRDINQKNVNLDDFKGKVILINFWATWCPPCVAEIPAFQELYNVYKGKIDFYFVTNDNPEKINLFLHNKGYDLPVFRPLEKSPNALASISLPTTYLISKKGEIIIQKVGAASWNSDKVHQTINDLLAE